MAITINGVTYRNLQQQVLWLTEKVEELEKGGSTSKTVTDIDFPFGDATVTYDTTDGMTITGTAKLTFDDGSTVNAMADVEIPIFPGEGINIDADTTGKKVIVKAVAQDYVSLTLPEAAIAGTITDSQLATLQKSDSVYIIINGKELYYLADKNTVNGILTYTHNGYNEEGIQKYLNLTTSTKAFTITEEKSTVEYVDIPSETGTLGADQVSILTDPMGLNCARYSGHILRLARTVSSNNTNVYYYNGLNGSTLYTLSLTKDTAGAGLYSVQTLDLSGGATYTAGDGISISDNVISADYTKVQKKLTSGAGITFGTNNNTVSVDYGDGLKLSSPGSGEKLTIDDTVVQKKLTAGDNITISDDNVISATGGSSGGEVWATDIMSFGDSSHEYARFYVTLFTSKQLINATSGTTTNLTTIYNAIKDVISTCAQRGTGWWITSKSNAPTLMLAGVRITAATTNLLTFTGYSSYGSSPYVQSGGSGEVKAINSYKVT